MKHILSQEAFWMINKQMVSAFSLEAALILSLLIDKEDYYKASNQLDEEGFFYHTSIEIEKATGLTYHIQKGAIKLLMDAGFIDTKLKGLPAKLHFKIVENKISNFLITGVLNSAEQEEDIFNTIKNNTIKKEIIKKEPVLFTSDEVIPINHQIIDYLNEKKGGRKFEKTNGNLKFINARLKEGFKLDDFKKVIDAAVFKWINSPKMKQYIRPKTLFDGEKFNGYLVESDEVLNRAGEQVETGSDNFSYNPVEEIQVR